MRDRTSYIDPDNEECICTYWSNPADCPVCATHFLLIESEEQAKEDN